jgi:hypothetical protein
MAIEQARKIFSRIGLDPPQIRINVKSHGWGPAKSDLPKQEDLSWLKPPSYP